MGNLVETDEEMAMSTPWREVFRGFVDIETWIEEGMVIGLGKRKLRVLKAVLTTISATLQIGYLFFGWFPWLRVIA